MKFITLNDCLLESYDDNLKITQTHNRVDNLDKIMFISGSLILKVSESILEALKIFFPIHDFYRRNFYSPHFDLGIIETETPNDKNSWVQIKEFKYCYIDIAYKLPIHPEGDLHIYELPIVFDRLVYYEAQCD